MVVSGGATRFSRNGDLAMQHSSNPFKRHKINAETVSEWEELDPRQGVVGAMGQAATRAALPGVGRQGRWAGLVRPSTRDTLRASSGPTGSSRSSGSPEAVHSPFPIAEGPPDHHRVVCEAGGGCTARCSLEDCGPRLFCLTEGQAEIGNRGGCACSRCNRADRETGFVPRSGHSSRTRSSRTRRPNSSSASSP
jgi:hypothetical protein